MSLATLEDILLPAQRGANFDMSDPLSRTMNGSTIAQIDNKFGTSVIDNLVQATAANQPTLGDINGLASARSDDGNRWMSASMPAQTLQNITIFAVFERFGGNANSHLAGIGSSLTTNRRFRVIDGGFQAEHRGDSGGTTSIIGAASDTTIHIARYSLSSNSVVAAIDGVHVSLAGVYNPVTADRVSLLTFVGTLGSANGFAQVGQLVIAFGVLTEDQIKLIEGLLWWKWNPPAQLPLVHPFRNGAPFPVDGNIGATVPATAAVAGDVIIEASIAGTVIVESAIAGDVIVEGTIAGAIPITMRLFGNVLASARPNIRFTVPTPMQGQSNVAGYSFTAPPKDPDAILDYEMDWTSWLSTGETIVQPAQISGPESVSISLERIDEGKFVRWRLSGGLVGDDTRVTVTIDTNTGQRDERTIRFPVRER